MERSFQLSGPQHYPGQCSFGPQKRARASASSVTGLRDANLDPGLVDAPEGGVPIIVPDDADSDMEDDSDAEPMPAFAADETDGAYTSMPHEPPHPGSAVQPPHLTQTQPPLPRPPVRTVHHQGTSLATANLLLDVTNSALAAANKLNTMVLALHALERSGGAASAVLTWEDVRVARREVREVASVVWEVAGDDPVEGNVGS